ncbi:MAG: GNAT family N-acetyltransferase [Motilibacteraceae bacterium]
MSGERSESARPGSRRTERLVLRRWHPDDLGPFAALNADPAVVEHLPGPLSRAESDAFVERIEAHFDRWGFGLWAVEVADGGPLHGRLAGFTGLLVPEFDPPFAHAAQPCVEVGWRLARPAWGHGYATEAAREALRVAFGELGLPEVVSFTVPANTRSQAVMRRLGMTYDASSDFAHPRLPAESSLSRHVLFRIQRGVTP